MRGKEGPAGWKVKGSHDTRFFLELMRSTEAITDLIDFLYRWSPGGRVMK